MKRILITSRSFGQVSDEPLEMLKKSGFEIEFYNSHFEETTFMKKLCHSQGLIIGSHPLSEAAMAGAPGLEIVCKHGTGLDNIDLEAAERLGIKVTNVPSVNANAVADLTFALILDVARKISLAANNVKNGNWNRSIGVDVYGKNLSIIGFGEIGRNIAMRARGFSMRVYVYDPFLSCLPDDFSSFATLVSFQEVLANADFLTIHVPLNAQTRNMISAKEIRMMKAGSFLFNTSRGGIINEADLAQALEECHLAGAGLDVLEKEPPNTDHPLMVMDQVTITPHIGMYSYDAINRISLVAARIINDHFRDMQNE